MRTLTTSPFPLPRNAQAHLDGLRWAGEPVVCRVGRERERIIVSIVMKFRMLLQDQIDHAVEGQ